MSKGAMTNMYKDSKGFVWIATSGGINRYDGSEFKIFRCDAADPATIGNGSPTAITEDKNGIIWIATNIPRGMNAYNPVTGKFTRYSDNPAYRNLLPAAQILSLFVDSNNVLWMCAEGDGLYAWDQKTNLIKHFVNDPNDQGSLADNYLIKGIALPDGDILAYSAHKVDRYHTKTGQFSHYTPVIEPALSLWKWVPGIFCDNQKRICIPTDKGLYLLDSSMKIHVEYPPGLQKIFAACRNKFIELTPDEKIWMATDSGLFVFDPFSKVYSVYRYDVHDPLSISPQMYRGLLYDKSGVMWIQGGIINNVSLEKENFHIVINKENALRLGGPLSENVRRTFQVRSGQIFQTNSEGVATFNFTTKQFEPFLPDETANRLLKNHDIKFVFQDKSNSYWFGVDYDQLIEYDPKLKSWKQWSIRETHHFVFSGNFNFQSQLQDANGHIWFAGAFAVFKYDPHTKEFKKYFVDTANRSRLSNIINVVMEPGDGNVWFGNIGLLRYNANKDLIVPVSLDRNEPARILSTSKITYALKADSSRMWIGTDGSGMFLLDFKTGNCKRISMTDGLPNDRIFGISRDFHGSLWVATDDGLCKYIPPKNLFDAHEKGTFRTFTANYTWPVQAFTGPDSTLYFQMFSYNGLLYFHPDSLRNNPFTPPVYLTDFRLFNQSVLVGDSSMLLDSTIETKQRIVLSYEQNAFSITFAALSFLDPEDNKYAYQLEGFDRDWIYTNATHRFASYTNLDAGNYIFKVKASNNDGVWNETPAILYLTITPPWWQTWWFRSLVIVALAAIFYGAYRYRMQQVIRVQMIRNSIASDLHDDIGSTLNSISIFSEVAKQQAKENIPALDQIGLSSRKIVESMSDIVWTINPENDNLEKIISRMRAFAYQTLKAKKIDLIFEADTSINSLSLPMQVRKNFYLIFKEATNNMVKYSKASRAAFNITYADHHIHLEIRDDGIGFDTEEIREGNGIKSMKRRAKEIRATLTIESSPDRGTTTVLLVKL
jgi:signal transduction histidine kinase/ligand-binding sensor domain-containing protein